MDIKRSKYWFGQKVVWVFLEHLTEKPERTFLTNLTCEAIAYLYKAVGNVHRYKHKILLI